ncbi:MAG: cytidylate kinase [Firmicutes bacterium HGW-Firmicutes-14]|nr:MAG: cytidylate kinase [Firmicutes bacterium HGW-Firmicutes-14]
MQGKNRRGVVAIDGPAGAGKSTVARQVSRDLGYIYIDTGAMYRALTLKALRLGTDLYDHGALTELAHHTNIKISYYDHTQMIIMDGEDVSTEIRSPEVSRNVSLVALVPGVRLEMVKLQRELAREGGVVMDGRDIGSYVLPDADCKIFLTASTAERARRRARDLEAAGYTINLAELEQEIIRRDEIDSTREMAPLIKADNAILIDTSDMGFEEVVNEIKKCILQST